MATVPLKSEYIEEFSRPRDWNPRKHSLKGPLRLVRLCVLGTFLPALLITGPLYLRFRVYSEQLYPLIASDQRLIDGKVSTTWCQSQLVKVNGTFNAYLLNQEPKIRGQKVPVSMTRHLVLEDDMKEYWGFYLLRNSSVEVSTCVRWPGASLTIIRGHKHLHECAFIGDDSSEELEELVEIAEEQGLLNMSLVNNDSMSNEPEKMKRFRQGVRFHHNESIPGSNSSIKLDHLTSHELDAESMRNILTHLFAKTLETKKNQENNPHHRYEGTYRESSNIVRPPVMVPNSMDELMIVSEELPAVTELPETSMRRRTSGEEVSAGVKNSLGKQNSDEIFEEVLEKLQSLGARGKYVLNKLMAEIDNEGAPRDNNLSKKMTEDVDKVGENKNDEKLRRAARIRREIVLSSPLRDELNEDDAEGDAAVEEGVLSPDGIAEDRGTVNESTLNDRSNSEFWSSFSSSEERLLECNGLILNLPLTPHRHCTPKHEGDHAAVSLANTITYRVPSNGYYFFVFSSENEIQPNYIRIRFNLEKTEYDTSNPTKSCENSTDECVLPLDFFSNQKAVLELPLTGNDSQWNEEYVVVSTCEPRTAVYVLCIVSVPLLVLIFAFH